MTAPKRYAGIIKKKAKNKITFGTGYDFAGNYRVQEKFNAKIGEYWCFSHSFLRKKGEY
jgi:hypothetical protein